MSNFTSAEWVLIITTIFTGIVSVITAWKTNTGNRLTQEVKTKTEVQDVKLESIHRATNGGMLRIMEENKTLRDDNMKLRADLISLGAGRKADG